MSTAYRIGDLARLTGLTVRTLHHYDAEGLLAPSERTDAGHRRYTDADVARLQQIVSLRALGLPLADIRRLLDAPGRSAADVLDVLDRHRTLVRQTIADHTRLADRLDAAAAHLRHTGAVSADDLLHLIRLTTMFEKHFTPDQLDQLKARAEEIGQTHIHDVQDGWTTLFAEIDGLRLAGTPPDAPDVQALMAKAKGYIAEFTGGDAGLTSSLNQAVAANRDEMYTAWGIAPELGAYYDAAMRASSAGR